VFPKLKGTERILGGFIFFACSSTNERAVVIKPASSRTRAITLTALVQAGHVGVSNTTSTFSSNSFSATSGPYSSVNPVTFLKAPMKE
jgi:hypothetical protein